MIFCGRVSRRLDHWNERVVLAEALEARVVSDFKVAASFPTDHPLHAGPPGNFLDKDSIAILRDADIVLNLDYFDFGGALRQVWSQGEVPAQIISCSLDRYLHNGWSMDHQQLAPADLDIIADPDMLVGALLDVIGRKPRRHYEHRDGVTAPPAESGDQRIGLRTLAAAVNAATAGRDVSYVRLPLGMYGGNYTFRHPLDYLGGDGGGGIGAGPALTMGAALALRGTGRLPVSILGDGDYLMGNTALWTAVANQIPMLIVVANNHSYFNDEVHQERTARVRGRPIDRKWIGQRIDGPAPDLAGLARNQGAIGIGPIESLDHLGEALNEALQGVDAGKVVVVDVRVTPGYDVGIGGSLAGGAVDRS
jgi:thiamine pyrophosphate-dependent acetolactate synthase large subunit-like protein